MKVHLFTTLCALSTLCWGPAQAQTTKPTSPPAKKPAQAATPGLKGRVLFTVREDGRYQVKVHDLAKGTTKPFSGGAPSINKYGLAVSPAGKTIVLMERGRPAPDQPYTKEIVFRSIADPKKVLLTLPRAFMWPAFLDETTVLIEEYVRDANATDKYRIHKIDLKTGNREVLLASPERGWDDVPLILSPDRKRAVFYERGGPNRGLRMLDIKTKQVSPVLPDGTFLKWSPDSKHVMAFLKRKKKLVLAKLKQDGAGFDVVKDLSSTPAIGGWLNANVRLIAAMSPKAVPGIRAGMVLTYHDDKAKQTVKISEDIVPSDETLLRFFAPIPDSSSFVWLEGKRRTMRLMLGSVSKGKLTKRELATGGRMAMPFVIP